MCAANERPLVVVIENERHIALALSLLIEDWGYSCQTYTSAVAAVRALGPRVRAIRALIVDYQLDDGYTGDKAASGLAAAIGSAVPTIMTTAHAGIADVQTIYPVIPKPFDPEVLKCWLETTIHQAA